MFKTSKILANTLIIRSDPDSQLAEPLRSGDAPRVSPHWFASARASVQRAVSTQLEPGTGNSVQSLAPDLATNVRDVLPDFAVERDDGSTPDLTRTQVMRPIFTPRLVPDSLPKPSAVRGRAEETLPDIARPAEADLLARTMQIRVSDLVRERANETSSVPRSSRDASHARAQTECVRSDLTSIPQGNALGKTVRILPEDLPRARSEVSRLDRTHILAPGTRGELTPANEPTHFTTVTRGRVLFGDDGRAITQHPRHESPGDSPQPCARGSSDATPSLGAMVSHDSSGDSTSLDVPAAEMPCDLGSTRALSIDELFARRRQIPVESAPPEPRRWARLAAFQRRLDCAISIALDTWNKLPRARQRAFALLLVCGLVWGACELFAVRPAPPAAAFATPVEVARVNVAPSEGAKAPDALPSTEPSVPLPDINPRITMERAAVDAVAEGRYAVAIRLYYALGRAQPNNPVYGEAARVLTERTRPHP